MNYYTKKQKQWAQRRAKALAMLAKGIPRRIVAERMGFTRQRLHQIEKQRDSGN
jgi:hypothetical protein